MPTPERIEKVRRLLAHRQPDLRVVLEGVAIAHNASAVIRTCDAAGVMYLDIVSPSPDILAINRAISTRAEKWIETRLHGSLDECLPGLKEQGFKVAVTHLGEGAVPHTDLDYTQPIAVVFGSESSGVSLEALGYADYEIRIPMFGMVQSLNLSVSVAVVLYEAMRQRLAAGFYRKRRLSDEEYDFFFKKWLSSPSTETDG
jgi:tRNA (guanosine-2'-O-)-methyltransferase